MALTDKEVEKELLEAGNKLLAHPSSIPELLSCLDRVEYLLTKVEQSPSESMRKALSPSLRALISNPLSKHPDSDVKASVAACISEVTRITAPDTPFGDDEMKDVFQIIVSCFEKLDDRSSRSYSKRTRILDTVAKVRSCVVMLDLECDALISEMFQHFFKSIRSEHPPNVHTSMETIMTLVLEESEEVPIDLVSYILNVLKTENKEVLPAARKLGEKVIEKCADKIKPCLEQAIKSLHTTKDDYPKIVVDLLKSESEPTETTVPDSASKNVAEENNVANQPSEKAVEVAPPSEDVGQTSGGPPKSPLTNGEIQKEIEETSIENDTSKDVVNEPKCEEESKTEKTEVENSVVEEEPTRSNTRTGKVNSRKGKRSTSSRSSTGPSGPSEPPIIDEKESVENSDGKDDKKDGDAENEKEPETLVVPSPSRTIPKENASETVESRERKDEEMKDVPTNDVDLKDSEVKKSVEKASASKPRSNMCKGKRTKRTADVSKEDDEKINKLFPKYSNKSSKKVGVGSESEDKKKQGKEKETTSEDTAKIPSKDEGKTSGSLVKSPTKPAKDENDLKEESESHSKKKRSSKDEAKKSGSLVKSPTKPAKDESDVEKESESHSKKKRPSKDEGKKSVTTKPANDENDVEEESESHSKRKRPSKDEIKKSGTSKPAKDESGAKEESESHSKKKRPSKDDVKKSGSLVKSPTKPAKDESDAKEESESHSKKKRPSKDEVKKSSILVKSPTKPTKDESDKEEESESHSKRKRSSENKKTKLGTELVGAKVKVWWPDDEMFYEGVIEHFDISTGKHKVTYSDGDVEVLKLSKETWKFVDGSGSDQGHSSDDEVLDGATETPKAKKAKTSPGTGPNKGKIEASAKKGGASSSKSKATSSKSQSEKKKENKSGGKTKKYETLKNIAKSEENKSGKSKDSKSGNTTPKPEAKSKANEVEPSSKGSNKSKQETPKVVSKSKVKPSKSTPKPEEKSKDEDDEEIESSPKPVKPEPVKASKSSKGKSGSKSQKSSNKRKRS